MAPRSALLAALLILILWGLITHGSYAGTGDEPHYQMVAHSLAFDGDFDLANNYPDEQNLAFRGRLEAGAHARPGKDGRLRPVHDVGLPILLAPYYRLAYPLAGAVVEHVPARWLDRARLNFTVILRHLMSFLMIALTAWMAVVLLGEFSASTPSRGRAFGWVLLLVLSPPLVSHSFLLFTEMLSALLALLVFRWLRGSPTGRIAAFLAGAAAGSLLLVHARNVGLLAGLLAVAVYRSRRWPVGRGLLPAFLGGVALLVLLRTGVTYHFWGTWVTTPQARLGEAIGWWPFLQECLIRLTGWLFDQEHGLLPYTPIYLLAPAGWFALWRRDRELCVEISVVIAAYVGVMTLPTLNAHGWRGGWTPAARFLVPVAPFLAALVFSAVARVERLTWIVWVIVGAQVGLDLLVWQRPGLLWNDGVGRSALLVYLDGGTGWLSSSVPSLIVPIGLGTMAIVAAATIAWGVLTVRLVRRSGRPATVARWSPIES